MEFVEWTDSAGETGWGRLSAHRIEPMTCYSVGFLVDETDTHVALMQSANDDKGKKQHFHNLIVIPKVAITGRRMVS